MPKGIPLTEEELNRRRHEIFNVAVNLFVEKGFTETSMREIAEAAGIGKSTLYDYFPSKDEILITYIIEEVGYSTSRAKEIIALEVSAGERLRRIMHRHVEYMLSNKSQFLRITFEAQRLSFENQMRIQKHRHAYQDMLCELVQEGIQVGEFRTVNPLMAVRGMLSLLTAFIYTSRPTGSPDEMMQDTLDLFFKGLEA